MQVLIVGAGAVGRWFAGAIPAKVAFADIDPAAADRAADALGGRSVAVDADESYDAVCVAVPMGATTDAIVEHAPKATDGIVDLAGAMTGPTAAMREHAPDRERLSLHPLFAPENAPGRIAAVWDARGPVTEAFRDGLVDGGNSIVETTPDEHDRAMETVQAKAHAAVLAFAIAADDVPDGFGTPVFDALREVADEVLGGNPRVYADIQETFDGAGEVADAARRVAAADRETFERLYRDAGR